MAHDIYICHSSEDQKLADEICQFSENNNFKCWIAPRDIRNGGDMADEIKEAIINSRIIIFLRSEKSQESDFIMNEIREAFSHNKPILSVSIDDSIPDAELNFYLKNNEWFNGESLILGGGWSRLLEDITQLMPSFEEDGLSEGVVKDADNASSSEIYENGNPLIFLSYNINDSAIVRHEINMLSMNDYEASENIDNSSLSIVYLSKNSIKSCMDDIKNAFSKDIPIILVYLEELKLKFGLSFKVKYKSKINGLEDCSIKRYLLDDDSYYESLFKLIKDLKL